MRLGFKLHEPKTVFSTRTYPCPRTRQPDVSQFSDEGGSKPATNTSIPPQASEKCSVLIALPEPLKRSERRAAHCAPLPCRASQSTSRRAPTAPTNATETLFPQHSKIKLVCPGTGVTVTGQAKPQARTTAAGRQAKQYNAHVTEKQTQRTSCQRHMPSDIPNRVF